MNVLFIRHGYTSWSVERRLQGHTDIRLSRKGKRILNETLTQQNFGLPLLKHECPDRKWFCSPLLRAIETAELLALYAEPNVELIEMDWGQWAGKTFKELRREDLGKIQKIVELGLDMTPPGGESPGQVLQRLSEWALKKKNIGYSNLGIVAHKGVLHAILSEATMWDMKSKPKYKLDYSCAHEFVWNGNWQVKRLNIPLLPDNFNDRNLYKPDLKDMTNYFAKT